jgi:hypothetical protein
MSEHLSSSGHSSVLDDFLALSRILTGVEGLKPEIGRQYLDHLSSTPLNPSLREILAVFQECKEKPNVVELVRTKIVGDDSLRLAICQIILLWYTATVQDNLGAQPPAAPTLRFGTPEEYFSGLVWTIIGAHPPGLSGGYFGHWRYRPDSEPKEPT